jgi:hypothetical protein
VRFSPDTHKPLLHPQHVDFFDVGVADTDPHPHPVPPADFTSASSAQQVLVPDGAGPPQQVFGALPCASDVSAAPRFVVCDSVVSIMTDSWLWPAKSDSRRSTRKTGRRAVGRKRWQRATWRAEAALRLSGACPVYTGRATEIARRT